MNCALNSQKEKYYLLKKNTMQNWPKCKNVKSHQGFTLVEVMVTIGIIGILTAIAMPTFSRWVPNYRLKESARNIYSNFQRARLKAIKNNVNVVISFNVAGNSYQIFVDDGGTTGTAADDTQNGDEQIITTVNMPQSVTIYSAIFSGLPTAGYTSRGMPLKGRFGNVQLKNDLGDRWYKLTMSMAGGIKLELGADVNNDGIGDSWI